MSCRFEQISIRKGRRNASVGDPVEALEPRRLLSSVDAAWSVDSGRTLTTAVPPSDSRVFLGPFGRDELLTLSLDNLPAHTSIVVVYEFFLIGSWNGNAEGAGGATDSLKIISEVPAADPAQNKRDVLLDKTFSNTPDSTQSYGKGSADNYPATSGAAEVNTLGYFYTDDDGVDRAADSVYREYHVLAHDSPTLRLNFAARVSTTPINESYGIGDIGIAFTTRGIVDLDVGVPDATEQTLGRHIVVNDDFDERDPSVDGAPAADSANNVPLAGDGEVISGHLSLSSGVELFQYFLPNFRLTPQFATTPSQTKWELGFPESLHVWWRHANSNVPWQAVEDHVFYPQSLPAELDLLIEANAPGLGQSLGAALYQPQTVASNSGDGTANLYVLPSDRVTLHAIDPDLDADTDNDGTLGRTWQEEVAEDTTGLAIGINDADADGDNTPGYADFAAAGGLIDPAAFSKVLVELPAPINASAATIRFNYSGSDPSQLGPDGELPADGRLRLWRRNPAEDRNPADAAAGGDYVAAGAEYPLAALGIAAAADARVAALWLEGVRRLPRSADGDYATAFAAYLDPDGPVGPAEAVRVDDPLKVNVPFAPGGNGAAPSADLDLFEDLDGDLLHDNSAAAESAEESNPTYIGVESDPYPTRLALVLDGLDAASTVSIIYHPSLTLYFDANRTQVVPSNEPLTLSQLGLSPSGSGTATLFADAPYPNAHPTPYLHLGGSVTGTFPSFTGGLLSQAGNGGDGTGGGGDNGGGNGGGGNAGTLQAPSDFTVTILSNTEARLDWQDPNNNEDGFGVFWRAADGAADWIVLDIPPDSTQYVVNSLQQGTTYDFMVGAFNAEVGDALTEILSATTPTDPATTSVAPPTSLSVTPSVGAITLNWQDAANNELGYAVERRINGGTWQILAVLGPNRTTYSDEFGLSASQSYQYRVKSLGIDKESLPVTAPATSPTAGNGLATPDLRIAQKLQETVVLAWDYALTGGQTMTIYAGSTPDFRPQPENVLAEEVTGYLWIDEDANPSQTTYYRVAVAAPPGSGGQSDLSSDVEYQSGELETSPEPARDLVDNYVPNLDVEPLPDDVLLVGFYGAGEDLQHATPNDPAVWGNDYIQMLAKQLGGTIRNAPNVSGLPYQWTEGHAAELDLGRELDGQNGGPADRVISGVESDRDVRIFGWSWGAIRSIRLSRSLGVRSVRNSFGGTRVLIRGPVRLGHNTDDLYGDTIFYRGGYTIRTPVDVKVLATFDPVNKPGNVPLATSLLQIINSSGPPRSNVKRFVNLYQSQNDGYKPLNGVDPENSNFWIRETQNAAGLDPGDGTMDDGGFLAQPWNQVTFENANTQYGDFSNATNALKPTFTGNAFDPTAVGPNNAVQIDLNTSDSAKANGNDLQGHKYNWSNRFWYTSPFWPEMYGAQRVNNNANTQGGVFGRDVNHQTVVIASYWWIEQELRGNVQDFNVPAHA